jgi:molybdate transport system ATP-binding protein
MSLQFSATLANRRFDLTMQVHDRETVAILGPNGAGKSTILAVIAGLLRPDAGRAVLDERVLFDIGRGGASRVWVPPHARGTALLAQDPLLFPHLSAIDNVAFGPRSAGARRAASRASARQWLEEVDAVALADRKPAQLSGGQAQRIAVARALAAEPSLLLLDEPMAALDVAVAPTLRQMLRRVLKDRTAVIVTHDPLDALVLAKRIVVVEDGRVVEDGPTQQVLAQPRSPFAARIAGLNLVAGTARGRAVQTSSGLAIEGLSEQPIGEGEPAVAVFSPRAVAVYRQPPGGSPRNAIPVTVSELVPHGEQVRIRSAELSADVTVQAVADLDLVPGTEVIFAVKASEVAVYPA